MRLKSVLLEVSFIILFFKLTGFVYIEDFSSHMKFHLRLEQVKRLKK